MDTQVFPESDSPRSQSTGRGRPPHVPTNEQRAKVAEMAGLGIPHYQIGISLDFGVKTLRKYYRRELTKAAIAVNHRIVRTLHDMAVSGKFVAATIFWVKTRCGFRENVPANYPTDELLPEQKQKTQAGDPATTEPKAKPSQYPTEVPPRESIVVVGPNGERVI
jgi:hypothetical protein